MRSWLRCCSELRNICAHYGRLYYRIFPSKPSTPSGFPYILQRKLFDEIIILKLLYPDMHEWDNKISFSISNLINEYEDAIDLVHIGFPSEWQTLLVHKDVSLVE
jgi:abortive infection bacteriophage resistance protein